MPKGVPFTELDFAMIGRALMRGMSLAEAAKATHFSYKTVQLVERSEGDYERYKQLRKEEHHRKVPIKEEWNTEQDIHDIAREMANIKSILMKIAEAWGVKM